MHSTATGAPRRRLTSEGQTGLRDRCHQARCQAGLESYRLVRATVRSVLGSFPCRERLQPPPGQREPVKHPMGPTLLISLLLKGRTITQSSDGICWSMYFSRSTKNDPFIQSITNDDVLANKTRREHHFFMKQFTGLLRSSAGLNEELQSIQSFFQQRSDTLIKLERATQVNCR